MNSPFASHMSRATRANYRYPLLAFLQRKKENSLHEMSYLVAWYLESDPAKMYAFKLQDEFVTWSSEGDATNYHLLPASIQKKLDSKRALSASEQTHVLAQDEMVTNLKKSACSQTGRIQAFQELYELITEHDLEKHARSSSDSVVATADSGAARSRKRKDGDNGCRPQQKIRSSRDEPRNPTSVFPEQEEVETPLNDDVNSKPRAIDRSKPYHSNILTSTISSSDLGSHSEIAETMNSSDESTSVLNRRDGQTTECGSHSIRASAENAIAVSRCDNDARPALTRELNGQPGIVTTEDPVVEFCKKAQSIVVENKDLRSGCTKLEAEIRTLRQEHLTQLQLLQRYDSSSENNDDTDVVVYKGKTSFSQLDEVAAPTIEMTDKNYLTNFASYLQKVEASNTDLRRKQGQLEREIEDLKVTHSHLKEEVITWKDQYDALMNQRKELTKKAHKQCIKACRTGTTSCPAAETR